MVIFPENQILSWEAESPKVSWSSLSKGLWLKKEMEFIRQEPKGFPNSPLKKTEDRKPQTTILENILAH